MKVKLALPRRSRAAIWVSRGHTTFSNLVWHSRLELKVACLAVAEDSKLATSSFHSLRTDDQKLRETMLLEPHGEVRKT